MPRARASSARKSPLNIRLQQHFVTQNKTIKMRNRIKPILIKPSGTIREAMAAIELSPHSKPEPGPAGIALVTDRRHKLLGILTDGDIRKAILGGVSIDSSVSGIMKKNPVTVKKGLSAFEMMRAIIREIKERNIVDHKLDKIVVVDDDNGVHDVLSFFELWKNTEIHARNVYIVGLGYVGLTLALTLCEVGFKVHGIDTDKKVAASLRRGRPHFHEVGLEPLLKHHINKNFFVQSDFKNGESDIYIIAVNTPVNEKGEVVFDYLKKVLNLRLVKIFIFPSRRNERWKVGRWRNCGFCRKLSAVSTKPAWI